MNDTTTIVSARSIDSAAVALLKKDIRLARGIVVLALGTLASIALMEYAVPSILPSGTRWPNMAGACSMASLIAVCLMPGLAAVALSIGDTLHRGDVLAATLPTRSGVRWRSKLLVIVIVVALFALIAAAACAGQRAPMTTDWTVWGLAAFAILGVVWGFGVVGFTREAASAYLLALLLPVVCLVAMILLWSSLNAWCRELLWQSIGFDPRFLATMELQETNRQTAVWRFEYQAQGPLTLALAASMLAAGCWSAWRARAWIAGRHTASRRAWKGIAQLSALVVGLGAASTVVATISAQARIGFDVGANKNIQSGFHRAMSMSPEQLARATVALDLEWECGSQAGVWPFAWSDRFIAPGGVLRTTDVVWQPYTRVDDADWYVRHGMTIALHTRLRPESDRGEMLAAIERVTLVSDALSFTQRLDLAMVADEFGADKPLVALASRAIAEQRDPCTVLRAMEALAVRGGEMSGFPKAPCECRVRAYLRLRAVRDGLPAGAVEIDAVDRAIAVLAAPMSFVRGLLDAALAREDDKALAQFRPELLRRREALIECLDCDISTLIDAEGRRRE